jgi:hypothetical protein
VGRFREQNVLVGIRLPPLGCILERKQHQGAILIGMREAAGGQQHGTPADVGKVMANLIADNRSSLRHYVCQKFAELTDVPLSVSELKQILPERIVPFGPERPEKRRIHVHDSATPIENDQRLLQRIHDSLCLHMAGA